MKNQIEKAYAYLNDEALNAYQSCRIVAAKEHVGLDYIVEVFLRKFKAIANKEHDNNNSV